MSVGLSYGIVTCTYVRVVQLQGVKGGELRGSAGSVNCPPEFGPALSFPEPPLQP